jgi:hypothetical protein
MTFTRFPFLEQRRMRTAEDARFEPARGLSQPDPIRGQAAIAGIRVEFWELASAFSG